ncbi:hypothetical protein BH24ACT25_BH24ACT25_05590 [soil metagenome]
MLDAEAVDPRDRRSPTEPLEIRFPAGDGGADQDEEWCEVSYDGTKRRIRFHDYTAVYSVPGLYERLFYDELGCESPQTVRGLLGDELGRAGADSTELRVIDVGAGNGMVGEELAKLGVDSIVGVDIILEAAEAAERDRPGVYDDYFVVDLTDMPPAVRERLAQRRFNCLTSVAALGFGDMPPRAFAEAYNFVADGGWIAFNIKEDFLSNEDGNGTGFASLIRRMLRDETLEVLGKRRYRHRLSMSLEPLHYVAMVARKRSDVPGDWLDELDG